MTVGQIRGRNVAEVFQRTQVVKIRLISPTPQGEREVKYTVADPRCGWSGLPRR